MRFLRRFFNWLHKLDTPETSSALAVSQKIDPRMIAHMASFENTSRLMESIRPLLAREELERQLSSISNEQYRLTSLAPPMEFRDGFQWGWSWEGKAGREFESVSMEIEHDGMFRVSAGVDHKNPIFVYVCAHRTTPLTLKIQSLMYASAEEPVHIWVNSGQPFTVKSVTANLRLNADVIRIWREKQLQEEGFSGSLPAPDSHAGVRFYRDHPELIP